MKPRVKVRWPCRRCGCRLRLLRPNGWVQKCVLCQRLDNRKYHWANREGILERKREEYKANREAILEYQRKYYKPGRAAVCK
jgi:hypothetical protein